ncbi:unnamed protein product [Symbiodinium microadriaticum]|nr:unnamed protein product [Symbiodinium microadriaticum]CAE7945958.1 unnamed protein product [Symbiodinium sp. KB8]
MLVQPSNALREGKPPSVRPAMLPAASAEEAPHEETAGLLRDETATGDLASAAGSYEHLELGGGDATMCGYEVGDGWGLVRRTEGSTFPDTDQLTGTSERGTAHSNPRGPAFSKKFDAVDFDEFLFATGDCAKWMIMKKSEVLAWYANSDRKVLKSHLSDTPYKARMYRRHGVAEDPWITYGHHDHCKGLYVENNLVPHCGSNNLGTKHQGLNVFIRNTRGDASTCNSAVGSGWYLVRRTAYVSFKDTDQLVGTSQHGPAHHNPLGPAFSVKFSNLPFNEFLFATGDCAKWMIMKKSEVLAWYANSDRKVLKSHLSDTPYKARMYRRHGVAEDPWITYGHHDHCKGLYVENNLFPNCWGGFFSKAPGAKHQGLNVFIRRTADWESRSGWIFAGGDVDGFETSSLQGAKHHCADNGSCKGFTMSGSHFPRHVWYKNKFLVGGGHPWASYKKIQVPFAAITTGTCEVHGMVGIYDPEACKEAADLLGYSITHNFAASGSTFPDVVAGCSVRGSYLFLEAPKETCTEGPIKGSCSCRNDPNTCLCQADPCRGQSDYSKCRPCPPGSHGTSPATGCSCSSGSGAIFAQKDWPGYSGGCGSHQVVSTITSSSQKVQKVKPTESVTKKEGVLYDLTSKIAEMCTVDEYDHASGIAAKKNKVCSMIPVIVVGDYMGSQILDKKSTQMGDTKCGNLPVVKTEKYFLFGIKVPTIPSIFEGGSLCFAQLMSGSSVAHGTGLLIFQPKLFVGNPGVKNLHVPVPGTGKAIEAASKLVDTVAVGVSFPSSGAPKMEMGFSNKFWECEGKCDSMMGNIYAGVKLDLADLLKQEGTDIGDFSVFIDSKCLVDFDPDRNGFMSQVSKVPMLNNFINGIHGTSGLLNLFTPDEATQFLREVLRNDVAMGVDGKLGITIPLKKWSHGMFQDLDVTVASASTFFRKTKDEIGLYVSVAAGGLANDNIMADIQQKILDKFQSPPVQAVVGLLGKGIGAVVDVLTSVGVSFKLYIKRQCKTRRIWWRDYRSCENSFGLKFEATVFEAFIQQKGDKMAFCFAIKGIYDSCGNGFENLLLLLQAGARMVVKVGKEIADAADQTFNAATKELAELSEASLQHGEVVVEKIGHGFEKGAEAAADFFKAGGAHTMKITGEAKDAVNKVGGHLEDVGGAIGGAIGSIFR